MVTPLLFPLLFKPDRLFLRVDLGVNTLATTPMLLWLFVFKFVPSWDVDLLNGDYAVTFIGIITLLSSVWAPALYSYSPSMQDAPGPLKSELIQQAPSTTVATSIDAALSAGLGDMRTPSTTVDTKFIDQYPGTQPQGSSETAASVLAGLCAFRLISVSPLPTGTAIACALRLPGPRVLLSTRDLRIVGALLISTATGRVVLDSILSEELSCELLAFIVDSCQLRYGAGSTSSQLMPNLNAMSEEEGAEPDAVTGAAVTVGADVNPRGRLASVLPLSSVAQYQHASRVNALISQYVAPSSPFQVNLSARCAQQLQLAATAFSACTVAPVASTLRQLREALRAAEHEVFMLIITGPLFRMLQAPSEVYVAWARRLAEVFDSKDETAMCVTNALKQSHAVSASELSAAVVV
jgi:hypothetical protein